MPGALQARYELNDASVASHEEMRRHPQPHELREKWMRVGPEGIREESLHVITVELTGREADAMNDHEFHCGVGGSVIAVRRSHMTDPLNPAIAIDLEPGLASRHVDHGKSVPRTAEFFVDAQAGHAVPQCPEGDPEQLRGCGSIETGLFQGIEDRLPLYTIEMILQVHGP